MSAPATTEVVADSDDLRGPDLTGSATSRDGTRIGFRQLGQGPALVVLHGTMSSGSNHTELAAALARDFTVIVPDRRGRGLSGPHPSDYSLATEVDDLAAVLDTTGARHVFGVSAGGIVGLETALTRGGIDRVALFEPPIVRDRAWAVGLLSRLDGELAQGRLAAALVTAMLAAQMGPPILRLIPRRLMEHMTARYMASQDAKGSGRYLPMRSLAPLLRYDFAIIAEVAGQTARFSALGADVLLLGAGRSPAYLKHALEDLQRALPNAHRVELPRLDHAASWNSDLGGRPEPVAEALRPFFA